MAKRIKQPHEALYLNGNPIHWRKPPDPAKIVKWSKKDTVGREIRGSFRTICHLNRLNNLAINKFGRGIEVIQRDWNTTVAASAGTHDFDSTFDVLIPGVGWWAAQRFLRANGFACWYRPATPGLWGNHIHGFTLPPRRKALVSDDFRQDGNKVGIYVDGGYSTEGRVVTSSQIADYYNHRSGLRGHAHDSSWFPRDIRTTIFNLDEYVQRRARLMD